MQAITVKYHGPTNTQGSRFSATTASGIRVYTHYDHSIDRPQDAAFRKLLKKLDWKSKSWAVGGTKDATVYVPIMDTIELD